MQTKNKVISVIIPVYNLEKYISRCLDSVCKQSYPNLQIIVVNDGSTDASEKICREYCKKDDRIELINKKNGGVSSARNLGLEKAIGEYITFVDGDDFLKQNAYQVALDRMQDSEAVFFGFIERYDKENVDKIVSPVDAVVDGDEALYKCFLPLGYHAFVCNKIFKKNVIGTHRFDERLKVGEDECWLSTIAKDLKKVTLISDPLYIYIQRQGSAMHSEYKVDEKWLTVLRSKKQLLMTLSGMNKSYKLSKAKVYNDLFHLTWYAYVSDDSKNLIEIRSFINNYRRTFFEAKEYSINRKIKFLLINIMINMHFPKSIVQKIGDMTTFKTKILISEGKAI